MSYLDPEPVSYRQVWRDMPAVDKAIALCGVIGGGIAVLASLDVIHLGHWTPLSRIAAPLLLIVAVLRRRATEKNSNG